MEDKKIKKLFIISFVVEFLMAFVLVYLTAVLFYAGMLTMPAWKF